jgi:NAD-dependent dihydropyrimidine dehydrogenase PreA subunit
MRKFLIRISNLQDYEKKKEIPVYIINTYAYVNAFGPIAAKKMFVDTYFYIQAYVNIRLCNNISKPKLKPEKLSKKKLQKRIDHALRELNVLYKKLISDKKYITGIGAYLIPGILIRSKLKNAVLDNYKSLSVNNDTCLNCMQCVEHCPTRSIQYNEGKFDFLSDCTACMR